MKQSTINIRVIEPSEGYYLTQANRKDNEEVILSEKVILSAKDSPDNWVEIAKEDGETLQKRVSAEFMAKAEAKARANEMGG
ncbi:MAG: hypothetical protein IKB97_02350 [Bacteroidaceae bacterium]|nr:hypothetical protein [Bacteroidaceae bacterium]